MGTELQRPSGDLAAISGGLIERPLLQTLFLDETVPFIKKERQKRFI